MQESTQAALSYIRSRATRLGLERTFYQKVDLHVHCPEGAIPKDGPSAGITMATAMASALTRIPVRRDVAMTGEITLRGRVLPIGGLKEKVIAAHRGGVKTVVMPAENAKDIRDIPKQVLNSIELVQVDHMDDVLRTALVLDDPESFMSESEETLKDELLEIYPEQHLRALELRVEHNTTRQAAFPQERLSSRCPISFRKCIPLRIHLLNGSIGGIYRCGEVHSEPVTRAHALPLSQSSRSPLPKRCLLERQGQGSSKPPVRKWGRLFPATPDSPQLPRRRPRMTRRTTPINESPGTPPSQPQEAREQGRS